MTRMIETEWAGRRVNVPDPGQHRVEVLTMAKVTCSADGCENGGKITRGWCRLHYQRWRKHGDPLMLAQGPTPEERFWAKVDKAGPDGYHSQTGENLGPCWLWVGGRHKRGYGKLQVDGRTVPAHRFAYELLVGPVSAGLQLDHLCRVRRCVNPDHLEPVTCRENLLRGDGHTAKNAAKTACLAGHAYSPENTRVHKGKRYCRACERARRRVNGARKKPRRTSASRRAS